MAATIIANATMTLYNGIPRSSTSGHLLLPPRCAPSSECDPSVLWCSSSSYQLRWWSLSSLGRSWSRRWPGWSTGGLEAMALGGGSLPSFYSPWTDSISMCPGPFAGTPSSHLAAPRSTSTLLQPHWCCQRTGSTSALAGSPASPALSSFIVPSRPIVGFYVTPPSLLLPAHPAPSQHHSSLLPPPPSSSTPSWCP